MNRRDKLIGEPVICDWIDSCGDDGWVSDEHAVKHVNIAKCQTAGYLVSRDRTQVKLALSKALSPGVKPWGTVVSIPRVAVTRLVSARRRRG